MIIEQILAQLDELFAQHKVDQVENFLLERIDEAVAEGDMASLITLLNEMIGHYRETGEAEKSISCCRQVLLLMEDAGLKGSVAYATTLLNVANACRAAGLLRESMVYFQEVNEIYEKKLTATDFRYASLYNNMSLLFQEMGDYESACDCLERALGIAVMYSEARIEVAVTHTNLAASQLKLGRYEEAIENLNKAFSIFEMDEDKDYHYSGALSAMGEAQYMAGNLEESARYYKLALKEIERNVGRSKAYEITLQNLNAVTEKLQNLPVKNRQFSSGMELCQAFYEEYGKPMIRQKFPEYEKVIAVGLVGEGSECFGFDDQVSRDHDFGPGFCMWLTEPVYDEIGEELQKAYEELPSTYMGITRFTTVKAQKRVGVFRIGDFYENLIGLRDVPTTQNQWLFLEDYRLATAVNGKVFRDDLGEFSRIRKGILAYYPEEVRIKKIAREAALMAQSGQYNYSRMFGRGEKVTAAIALAEFMRHTMAMVYLLNRTYAPFYKWMHKGMKRLVVLSEIGDILDALVDFPNGDERIPQTIEMIVALIIAEMKKQGLTSGEDNYLDNHTDRILRSIPEKEKKDDSFKSALVDELVSLEWEAFDKVDNEGGRADCQDDWNTFSIMRKSQYDTWTEPMLKSYIRDFHRANDKGWNLITEKYARMMESTASLRYAQIKDSLPKLPSVKKEIIEEIVKIQVEWMEEFAASYPKAAMNARSIHTTEDTPFHTSYETYLRGEISTYSDETLDLYGRFIAQLCREDKNLAKMIMTNTALLYGYGSLEELEEKL
ncbi:DUF4125 family protein [Parablautia muri]|uniref:DUF4125 family protein n=1 Tax=Parablautia muri TaxID=2320879 RepID=A0A9X5GQS2_9FIRM|nr:DUF4125 family protein [Parablautia muri]NBJ91539.1 DUF4125 family protein [Parablautia muri]